MPSAPPSSADSKKMPNARKGSIMVVSGMVRSVNQEVPPVIKDGTYISHRQNFDALMPCYVVKIFL